MIAKGGDIVNLSSRDKRIIEKAVSFFISRHFEGIDEESERRNRESALRALETVRSGKERIHIEEVRALSLALTKFADKMSNISAYNDKPAIIRAYQMADELLDQINAAGL